MKKLHLNKIFHWLYAFLMFYPILAFFATVVISAFNGNLSFGEVTYDNLSSTFWNVIDSCTFSFDVGTVGFTIDNVYSELLISLFGENTNLSSMVIDLLSYWTSVSLVYLIFDVLMYPINLFHKWIDEGGI